MRMNVRNLLLLAVLAIACWLYASFMIGFRNSGWLIVSVSLYILLTFMLAWRARKISINIWIVSGLIMFLWMFLPASLFAKTFPERLSLAFGSLMVLILFAVPSITIVIAALIILSGLNDYKGRYSRPLAHTEENKPTPGKRFRAFGLIIVSVGVLMLAKSLHTFYWLMVWDSTDDGLGIFWLGMPTLAAFTGGFVLLMNMQGREKLVGLLYSVLVPALFLGTSALAWRV